MRSKALAQGRCGGPQRGHAKSRVHSRVILLSTDACFGKTASGAIETGAGGRFTRSCIIRVRLEKQEDLRKMNREKIAMFLLFMAVLFSFIFSVCPEKLSAAGKEETIAGFVVKTDKGYVIEADDGDYLVKGKDLSKMEGKMVEATGIINESAKGDTIEVKSFEEIQE